MAACRPPSFICLLSRKAVISSHLLLLRSCFVSDVAPADATPRRRFHSNPFNDPVGPNGLFQSDWRLMWTQIVKIKPFILERKIQTGSDTRAVFELKMKSLVVVTRYQFYIILYFRFELIWHLYLLHAGKKHWNSRNCRLKEAMTVFMF